jgi:monoamine oxidase
LHTGDTEVVIIGGGAAGSAAARTLAEAGVPCLLVEARARLGGRGYTIQDPSGAALDLGCGWLHSAERNPWVAIAEQQGRHIDRSRPPWGRPAITVGFSLAEQQDYFAALNAFHDRIDAAAERGPDVAAATLLEPQSRWNGLIGAIWTYISGGELDKLSVRDLAAYEDTGENWRVVEGYGTTIAAHAADLSVALECPVRAIDHSGRRLAIETTRGVIAASAAIITVPTDILAAEKILFRPALPDKIDAARGLPLGLADKLFFALEGAEEFPKDSRLFARTDRSATAAYHVRPLGRPLIEAYICGDLARELEKGGGTAFVDFATAELVGAFGSAFAPRLKPLGVHGWATDPFAGGSYSYALPGHAGDRAILAAPVDDRLFFAGEACSAHDFSTAHGALQSGVAAAAAVMAAQRRP